ncbi:MAG TPA: zf-HC2 domain-containing protein [Candidatus Angelobacter sp.]
MTEKDKTGFECSQFESWLPDALDGMLSDEAKRAFEAHAAVCPVCGPMLAEAREGMLWLENLEEVEPPKKLVHNILAATSAAPAEEGKAPEPAAPGWLTRVWTPVRAGLAGMMRPRFATSFSMAFFSLSLTLTLAGVKLKDLTQIDWHPSAIGRAIVVQYTQVESKVVRYYNNMRLVYEVESRVHELRKNAGPEQKDQQQPAEQPKEKKDKKNNDTSGRPEERQDNYSLDTENALVASLSINDEGANR